MTVMTDAVDTSAILRINDLAKIARTLIGYLSTGGTTAARPGMVEVTGGVALFSAAHRRLVWLSVGVCPAGHRGAERLRRGRPRST